MAMAFAREGSGRVALSFIGDGGSSLGEWHEAINLCAARRLPAVFCIENNQTALSTPVSEQSAVRVFADKAAGYGIPGITIDGTDPDAVAAAFAWAAERARAGAGPRSSSSCRMRMCGHAHHDDMLFLGKEPQLGVGLSAVVARRVRRSRILLVLGRKDPIAVYATRLEADGLIARGDLERLQTEAPNARRDRGAGRDRCAMAGTGGRRHAASSQAIRRAARRAARTGDAAARRLRAGAAAADAGRPVRSQGHTFSMPSLLGIADALRAIHESSSTAKTSAAVRQLVSSAAAAARRSSAIASSIRQLLKAVSSVCASARHSPVNGRSAKCSSTISSPAASTSS